MKTITRLLPAVLLVCSSVAFGQAAPETVSQTIPPGGVSEKSLGEMLSAIGLKPLKTDKRYDFAFKTSVRGEEWKFSMSAVLSRNSETVWVMAWLDQIPSKASEVPRTALLKLLAANDRLGNGKFFAYIPTNKRFVLQRVLKNEKMTNKKLMSALQDLALSVADEYPTWAVAKWAPSTGTRVAAEGGSARTQTSESASKFSGRRIQ